MKILKKYWYVIAMTIALIIIMAISFLPLVNHTYKNITEKEVIEIMDKVKIIDVRTYKEYSEGHIENAINIPYDELSDQTFDYNKKGKIVVYYRTGARSKVAAAKLVDLGYTRVYDLGGIDKWTGKIVTN